MFPEDRVTVVKLHRLNLGLPASQTPGVKIANSISMPHGEAFSQGLILIVTT
jgi:hypothetical protein